METAGRASVEGASIPTRPAHVLRTVLLVWLLWLGVDFLAHGGLFAGLYETPSSFLLPSNELFARIPLGYLAFLMYVGMTVWLVRTLRLGNPLQGAFVGGIFGAAVTIAGNLAVLSISTIGLSLAAVWTFVQIAEFTVAGFSSVWVAREPSTGRAILSVGGITVVLLVTGIAAQNLLALE